MKRRLHLPSVQYWSDTVWYKTLCAPSPAEFLPLFLHLTVLNCLFSFYIFFWPRLAVGRHKDTSTHVRALDNFDLSRTDRLGYSTSLFGALFFISFYAYWRLWCFRCLFFFCVDWVSGACFFVINGLKVAHHSFIHDRCESSACQCVGCLSFFFANILLISSLNVLIIIVYMWRMLGKERAATLYSLWLYCIVVFFFIIVNHCLNENLYSHVIDVWPWWMQKITFHICVFMCMCVCLCVW